ncbi:hypothetical protein B7463_g6957, partial [Scytalidium lignicola]
MEDSSDQLYFSATESRTLTDNGTPPPSDNTAPFNSPKVSQKSEVPLESYVPVTPSMISTYSHMRGPMKSTPGRFPDPLHDGLCNSDHDHIELRKSPLTSPVIKEFMMDGWKKGDVVYWDPRSALKMPAPTQASDTGRLINEPSGIEPQHDQKDLEETEIKFQYFEGGCSFKGKALDYRDDQGLANHGYVPINGVWADPDSMGDVSTALKGVPPIDYDDLPGTQTRGPRVLNLEEQEKEYQYFMDYVSDDEGDPRDLRIDIATYAAWATGAQKIVEEKGETAGEQQQEQQDWARPEKKEDDGTKLKPADIKVKPQFDIETGSSYTGYYELDPSPSPLMSAQGVDAMRKPVQFTKSLPLVSQDIDRMAFVGSPPSLATSTTSMTPETLNSEGAHDAFDTDEYPNAWCEIKDGLWSLQEKRKVAVSDFMTKYNRHEELQVRKSQLEKENYFLKQCWAQKKQYFRYLKERVERDTLATSRTVAMGDAIDEDIEKELKAIREKEQEQETLLHRLGHRSIDEIPGLIPSRMARSF